MSETNRVAEGTGAPKPGRRTWQSRECANGRPARFRAQYDIVTCDEKDCGCWEAALGSVGLQSKPKGSKPADELLRLADEACGELAENAAHDLDHGGKVHAKWYRAVKRYRKDRAQAEAR